ncbi:DUF4283 domain-containing protein [Sweet potato little leaf phytoplasma]|uniref:DUF4283 domain-containing protein n=1 Tax=Candidatus Phytoplasma australasiaticum TaxID=2754999 RepID=UPI002713F21D|nr:DUF4283 domain-containing protein [Sweet potato little leaf phytoplasma]MDO7987361.1 DUF4283 domain-containing protein [Sweet potato little leaf phytoplasma]
MNMDVEELVNEWKNFNLMEKEKGNDIKLDEEDMTEIKDQMDHCIVGKLLSNRIIAPLAIKNALRGAWKTRKNFKVESTGKNIFNFKFECQEDRNWVMCNGPWTFDNSLIVLEYPMANQRSVEMEFKNAVFWIRLINLPMGYRNRKVASKIGNSIGDFIDGGECDEELVWGQSMRIRVRLDITKPLLRGFMLKGPDIKGECWVTIRYERLPELCFLCGKIGHVAKDCESGKGRKESNMDKWEFGNWLRFQSFPRFTKKPDSPTNSNYNQDFQKDQSGEGGKDREIGPSYGEKGKAIIGYDLEAEEDLYDLRNKGEEGTSSWTYDLNTVANMETELKEDQDGGNMCTEGNEAEEVDGEKKDEAAPLEIYSQNGEHQAVEKLNPEEANLKKRSPEKKKGTWKRKTGMGSIGKSHKDKPGTLKRKVDDGDDGGGLDKRHKGEDDLVMDVSVLENSVAEAVEQPCQGP